MDPPPGIRSLRHNDHDSPARARAAAAIWLAANNRTDHRSASGSPRTTAPSASPMRNVVRIVVNTYVVLPVPDASSRVRDLIPGEVRPEMNATVSESWRPTDGAYCAPTGRGWEVSTATSHTAAKPARQNIRPRNRPGGPTRSGRNRRPPPAMAPTVLPHRDAEGRLSSTFRLRCR
jgi:hypothetical protein